MLQVANSKGNCVPCTGRIKCKKSIVAQILALAVNQLPPLAFVGFVFLFLNFVASRFPFTTVFLKSGPTLVFGIFVCGHVGFANFHPQSLEVVS